jgi:hypothetical protein
MERQFEAMRESEDARYWVNVTIAKTEHLIATYGDEAMLKGKVVEAGGLMIKGAGVIDAVESGLKFVDALQRRGEQGSYKEIAETGLQAALDTVAVVSRRAGVMSLALPVAVVVGRRYHAAQIEAAKSLDGYLPGELGY